jgi:hypothetical protein
MGISAPVYAQKINGNLEGTVQDEDGNPVSYATVTVSGPSIQGVRIGLSGSNGYFLIPNLPVGQYTINITHVSFQEITFEDISIRLGVLTTMPEVKLATKLHEAPEIIVMDERPMIDISTTTVGNNLNPKDFEVLPLERDYRKLPALLPQANVSFYGDDMNYGGSTGLENKHFIDGMNVTDPYYGSTGMRLPYNFIREVEVKVGSYEAEYSSSLGGILNVITNSGSNDMYGSVFGFFSNNRFAAEPLTGTYEISTGDYSQYDIGFGIGGPIVKDKLWYYAAYNPTIEREDVLIPGLDYYEDQNMTHIFAGKLNWNATDKVNVGFTILGDPSSRDAVGAIFGTAGFPPGFVNSDPWLAEVKTGGVAGSIYADYFHSDRLFFESMVSYGVRQEYYQPRPESTESSDLLIDLTQGGLWSGGYFTPTDDMSYRGNAYFKATTILGSHTLKAGLEYEQIRTDIDEIYSEIYKYAEDDYEWLYWEARGTVKNRTPAAFIQDSWRVMDRLRLNLGIRWDAQYMIDSNGNTAQRITDQYQPRAGFIFQPAADGRQKVFGSFARFYQNLSTALSVMKHMEGNLFGIVGYSSDPRVDRTIREDIVPGGIYSEVDGLEGQYYDEFTLGYEIQFRQTYKAGITGSYRILQQGIEDSYIESEDDFLYGNPGSGALAEFPKMNREYQSIAITFERNGGRHFNFISSYVLSQNEGNYPGLFNSDYGIPFPNVTAGYDLLENLVDSDGLLPNDRTHVFKFAGSYRWDFGLMLGSTFTWASGTPKSVFTASSWGPWYYNFLEPRGTDGRTPSIWDLNFRLAYDIPFHGNSGKRTRLLLDLFHIGNPRKATAYDQLAFYGMDGEGNPTDPNLYYGTPVSYQPPMSVRLGIEYVF